MLTTLAAAAQESGGLTTTTIVSVLSFVIALVALAVNVSAVLRRPKIVARWDEFPGGDGRILITVVARRRPIEVNEVGVVILPRPLIPRRQMTAWAGSKLPTRVVIGTIEQHTHSRYPIVLSDGESLTALGQWDRAMSELLPTTGVPYNFVRASGTVYLSRGRPMTKHQRRRVGEFPLPKRGVNRWWHRVWPLSRVRVWW